MLLLASLLSPSALACLCVGADARLISPNIDATGVPTNTRIWIWNWQGLTYDPEDLAPVDEAGSSLGDLEIVEHGQEEAFLLEFRFTEELPPNTFVQIVAESTGRDQFQFTTGDGPDHSPPTWGGKYTTDREADQFCEGGRWIDFVFEGAEDNSGQDLVVNLKPRGVGWEIWGPAEHTGTSWSGLCGGEDSLLDSMNRSYDVTIYDVAGNALDAGVVSSCGGCETGGAGVRAWMILGGIGVVLGRRRRPGSG